MFSLQLKVQQVFYYGARVLYFLKFPVNLALLKFNNKFFFLINLITARACCALTSEDINSKHKLFHPLITSGINVIRHINLIESQLKSSMASQAPSQFA